MPGARIDFLCSFQREPMAGPVEHDVASKIGDVLIDVGEGVRQQRECRVVGPDHEIARRSDLGMQLVSK